MNQKEMFKNILSFNEEVLGNIYNSMVIIQDKTQKAVEEAMEKASFLPEEMKTLSRQYFAGVAQTRESIREAVLKGQEQMKTFV
ncbi:MAG: hypothetical protein RBR53_04525 [Desulforegulaceae bacterium]|nr:hypothetical protein [Desulforegulaceae bacterium]